MIMYCSKVSSQLLLTNFCAKLTPFAQRKATEEEKALNPSRFAQSMRENL